MNCSDFSRCLSESADTPLPREFERHLENCPGCRALSNWTREQAHLALPSAGAIRRIELQIIPDLKPVHPLLPRRMFIVAFLAVFALLAGIGVYRLGPFGWEQMTAMQKARILASLACSAGLLGMSLVLQMVPGSRYRISPALVFPAVFVFLLLVLASMFQLAAEQDFLRAGIWCLGAGTPYIVPAGVAFWLLLRTGAVLSARVAGMTAGALAGLVGMTVLQVHCANFDLLHIVTFHLGVLAIGAMAGLLSGMAGEFLTSRLASGNGRRLK